MTHMTPEKWSRFQSWRSRLARREVETNTRYFDVILVQEPVWTDYTAYQMMVYTFFRIYLSLPPQEQQKFEDLAMELRQIVNSP